MAFHRKFLNGHRLGAACVASAGICAALVLALVTNAPASSRTAEEDAQTGKSLATMLRSVRIVISKNQDRINDPNIGNKGLDGKAALAEAGAIYQQASGTAPASIDPNSLHGRLIRMQMDSIAEVMEAHQETINRQGVGFKGFIPAVFARLVNEAFGRRAAGMADIKVTAPPQLIRNPKVQPDEWELEVIRTRLMSASSPKDQSYSASVEKNARRRSAPSSRNITAPAASRATVRRREKSTLPGSRRKAPKKAISAASSASRCTDRRPAASAEKTVPTRSIDQKGRYVPIVYVMAKGAPYRPSLRLASCNPTCHNLR